MELSQKLCHLRSLEGQLRGFGRALSKSEVVRAMRHELGDAVSHAYLCQLESGVRTHMSPRTRGLLANFFKVHPGYLVDDPNDYQTGIVSELAPRPTDLRQWLALRAEEMREEPLVYRVLLRIARAPEPKRYLAAIGQLLDELEAGPSIDNSIDRGIGENHG